MSEESEPTPSAKIEREAHEERQLLTVVFHALGEDLVRMRRFLEMARAELEREEAHSARVTMIDPIELQTKAKPS